MRKMFNYPPLFLVLNLIVGILIGQKLDFDVNQWSYLLALSLIALFITVILKRWYPIHRFVEFLMFGVTVILVGIASYEFTDVRNHERYYEERLTENSEELLVFEIVEILKSNKTFNRFVAEVIQVNAHTTDGSVLLNIKCDSVFDVNVGSRILSKPTVLPIQQPKNPFEFNYANYLANQQIYHQVYLDFTEVLKLENKSTSFYTKLSNFRMNLISKLSKQGIKNEELGVMSALLLGERTNLTTDIRNSYINAGAIHILAISGLHIGILFLMLSVLFKPIKKFPFGNELSQVLILATLWVFAGLAGLSPSVVRAVTMFSFISIGLFLNRKNSVYHSLIASAFILLLVHPRFLFEVGFQLSYSAVFAIVWIQPKLEKLWNPKMKLILYFWKLITVSTAAQIGVFPISLFYFNQFPGLFFVSNLVIIPLLGVLLGLGFLVLILAQFDLEIELVISFYQKLITLLNEFIRFIAGFDQFVIQNIYWSVGLLISSYLLLISFFKYTEKRSEKRFVLVALCVFVFYGILFFETFQQKQQRELIIFHRNRETVVGILNGRSLEISGVGDKEKLPFVNSYITGKGAMEIMLNQELSKLMLSNEGPIVVIDSLGIYNFKSVENPIVLLRNSPRINLSRMIEDLKPSLIIADGSNYKSFVEKWEQSSLETKTPFHDTSKKGAFIIK